MRLIDADAIAEMLDVEYNRKMKLVRNGEVHLDTLAEGIMSMSVVLGTMPTVEAVRCNWIPVSERLPEQNGRYLCNVMSFAFPGKFYQAILMRDKHGFREGNIYTDDVTHWMPLPEPPKEDHHEA